MTLTDLMTALIRAIYWSWPTFTSRLRILGPTDLKLLIGNHLVYQRDIPTNISNAIYPVSNKFVLRKSIVQVFIKTEEIAPDPVLLLQLALLLLILLLLLLLLPLLLL